MRIVVLAVVGLLAGLLSSAPEAVASGKLTLDVVQPTGNVVLCYYEHLPVSSLGPIISRSAPPGTVCEIEGERKAVCKPVPRTIPK